MPDCFDLMFFEKISERPLLKAQIIDMIIACVTMNNSKYKETKIQTAFKKDLPKYK